MDLHPDRDVAPKLNLTSNNKRKRNESGIRKKGIPPRGTPRRTKSIANIIELLGSESILVYKPGEEEFQRSIVTSNLHYRYWRPALVVRPQTVDDVKFIVKQAKSQNLPLTIKSGGHSYSGASTARKGILLDLININDVRLDTESNTMTIQGGALWGHTYKALINEYLDRYMINGGRCPTVGVSGFVLGGGLGPFTRSFGMGSDTLLEARVVVADGSMVTVQATDNPDSRRGHLFWALCGVGGGNFGVVVELKMALSKLRNPCGLVVAGRFTWFPEPEDEADIVATMNQFYMTQWPDHITIDSTWVCDNTLPRNSGDLGVRFTVYSNGNKHDFDDEISKLIKNKDLLSRFHDHTREGKSTKWLHGSLPEQWKEEIIRTGPRNKSWSLYSSFIFGNDPYTIKAVTFIVE